MTQTAIPVGTILQNRYRLISILGQGGFGRTYLAEDQGRFNERCALKEFIPVQTGTYALQKSQELFRREAQILYQIRHAQIPQFGAVFEENQRLFLVQDYVEGKTYHALLMERKNTNSGLPKTFTEAEIVLFLRQMLPVLAHIHNLGIIHRDISPDNIILRHQDQLPILIDFGVVIELATRINTPDLTLPPATRVGKLGYAPFEQIQTGQAFPSSDLYALAVTAIVLLTGQEPQYLLDQTTLSWNWQPYTQVSSNFAQIIDKMLSRQPSDRYQSAPEVEQALQTLNQPLNFPPTQQNQPRPTPAPTPQTPNPDFSQLPTLAVGRPLVSQPVQQQQNQNPPGVPTPNNPQLPDPDILGSQPLWEKPATIIVVGVLVACLAAWGSWALVKGLLRANDPSPDDPAAQVNPPIASPSIPLPGLPPPTLTPAPNLPSPLPTPVPIVPASSTERLNLAVGDAKVVEGNLQATQVINYLVSAEAGQQFYASVSGEGVLLTLIGPDQQPINQEGAVSLWQGTLPITGDYTVILKPIPGLPKTDYKLELTLINSLPPIIPSEPEPEPEPQPVPEPEPEPIPQPTFAPAPEPTPEPTPQPTPQPTPEPTPQPTPEPTPQPTPEPTPQPTPEPTPQPTPEPTPEPTPQPTPEPTLEPSPAPEPAKEGTLAPSPVQ